MKTKFVIFFSLLISIQVLSVAQTSVNLDYLVINTGDTLRGIVKYIDRRSVNHKKIRLIDTSGHKKKYKKKDISVFRVNNTIYEGFWLNQSPEKFQLLNPKYDIDIQNGEKYFLKLVSKGSLSHYELEWLEQGESTLLWMDLLKKEEDPFFIRATQGLFGLKRKVLIDYFFNCVNLKEKINQKDLNKVSQIVDYYNKQCTY
tara:strand:- start:4226 stop:4828 length:603 start_codon:yes stop_codon:yes gene_type:complete